MHLMDYHRHTNHSFDSTAVMEEVCTKAIENKIKEICFTEHYSVNPLAPTYGHMNFDNYFSDIRYCQNKFQQQLSIKAGIELCEPHLLMAQYSEILKPLNLDFILGSIHNINNQKLRLVLKEHDHFTYKIYFEELYKMVSAADIDVIAHFDLIKRYAFKDFGIYSFTEHSEIIQLILEKAIERNIGIEINTSGLRGDLKEALPTKNIIQLYKELGGEILTIGSDSHKADSAGAGLSEAYTLAKECGFTYIFKFEQRVPVPVKI